MLMGVYIQHHWRALYIFTTPCFFVSLSSTISHFLLQSSFKFHRFVHTDNHTISYSMKITSDNFKTQTGSAAKKAKVSDHNEVGFCFAYWSS